MRHRSWPGQAPLEAFRVGDTDAPPAPPVSAEAQPRRACDISTHGCEADLSPGMMSPEVVSASQIKAQTPVGAASVVAVLGAGQSGFGAVGGHLPPLNHHRQPDFAVKAALHAYASFLDRRRSIYAGGNPDVLSHPNRDTSPEGRTLAA
jgi:hypothetical protein